MFLTRVRDLMTKDPVIISPDLTLKEAAAKMASVDCGALPVGGKDKVEGVITDRDIVIRAVAKGKDINKEKVRDYMTPQVCFIDEDDTPDEAAAVMRENNINRLLVQDGNGKPSGILTFGRIIREDENMEEIAEVIACAVGKRAA